MMKIVAFLSYSVLDELHYLKKPWRNLETFQSSLQTTFGETICLFSKETQRKVNL